MRVAFLLGSGTSVDAGVPSTSDLTHTVLSGDGYVRHSDGTYLNGAPAYGEERDPHVPHLASFLRWLACHVSRYYKDMGGRAPNYEDLYYVIEQICLEETGDLDNPLVLKGQRDIRLKLCDCAAQISPHLTSNPQMSTAAFEVLNYMTR